MAERRRVTSFTAVNARRPIGTGTAHLPAGAPVDSRGGGGTDGWELPHSAYPVLRPGHRPQPPGMRHSRMRDSSKEPGTEALCGGRGMSGVVRASLPAAQALAYPAGRDARTTVPFSSPRGE